MMNGLAIIEKNETETKGFYIDQDALEFARQNAKVNKRLAEAAKDQRKADRKHRRAEAAKAKRKAYIFCAVRTVLYRTVLCCLLAVACSAGMIVPEICVPVSLALLCSACLRLGALWGKVVR